MSRRATTTATLVVPVVPVVLQESCNAEQFADLPALIEVDSPREDSSRTKGRRSRRRTTARHAEHEALRLDFGGAITLADAPLDVVLDAAVALVLAHELHPLDALDAAVRRAAA